MPDINSGWRTIPIVPEAQFNSVSNVAWRGVTSMTAAAGAVRYIRSGGEFKFGLFLYSGPAANGFAPYPNMASFLFPPAIAVAPKFDIDDSSFVTSWMVAGAVLAVPGVGGKDFLPVVGRFYAVEFDPAAPMQLDVYYDGDLILFSATHFKLWLGNAVEAFDN